MVLMATFAQTQYIMGVSGTNITSCDAIIYDNGGASGNYGTGRDDWMTIRPSSGAITIRFLEFDVASTDTLYIYNGTDPNNDSIPLQIGSLSTNWINESNSIQVGDHEVAATIQNPTGALTLHFVSAANSETRAGFKLKVTCAQPCQRIYTSIDFENSSPQPHYDTELNDGYYYIDFCPGQTVHIATNLTFPDNNYSYNQTVANTYFDWSFGQSGYGRSDLDYIFNDGHGYDLTLTVRDSHNGTTCHGQNPVAIRVRGSQDPFVSAPRPEDVCQGTEVPLLISQSSNANIMVSHVGSTQETSLRVDTTVFIPDGPNCSFLGSQCYSSSVNFTDFPTNATVTSASDILGVRLNIEHTFIADINISLICPNNRSVRLMPDHNSSNGSADFGIPNSSDNGCYARNNPPGTGWNYCWTENSNYAQISGACYDNVHNSRVDSSIVAVGYPGQPGFVRGQRYYAPDQSFSSLVGCPLNGLWKIQVCDTWGQDNGYVFGWELTLDPRLMPQDWTYSVELAGSSFSGGNVVSTSDTTAYIITDQPGDYTYTFTLVDEFGCEFTHDMPALKVVQQPDFTVSSQYICEGETATLDPGFEYVGAPGLVRYNWTNTTTSSSVGSNPTLSIGESGNYSLCISTFNNNSQSLICSKCDTADVIFNPQPVVNFSANLLENCSPLITNLTPDITYTDNQAHTGDVNLTYLWTITDESGNTVTTSNQANPTFNIQGAGIYSISLYVETQHGCHASLTKNNYFTVYAQPISDFLSNPERTNLGEGGTITFINITDTSVFVPGDAIHWTWNYGEGDETHDFNGEHTYSQWGEYNVTLSVLTDRGCQSAVSHLVYIEADLIFPNIITPNGDGKNDVFAIKNMNPLIPNVLSIYDRWGKKVYEKQNYQTYIREGEQQINNESDGFSADKLSDGVYYYTFHYEGYTKAVDYHGTLTIIRDK